MAKTNIAPPDMAPLRRQRVGFFDLARELRDMIYEHYVMIDGGYMLNPETWRLRPKEDAARNNVYPFGLQLTCKLVAREMRGLPLKYNLITFRTVATMRKRAFQWEALVDMSVELCIALLEGASHKDLYNQMPESLRENISRHCPDYLRNRLLERELLVRSPHVGSLWPRSICDMIFSTRYVAPSVRYAFPRFIMQRPELASFFARLDPRAVDIINLDLHNQPWKIPSEEENESFLQILTGAPVMAVLYPKAAPCITSFLEHSLNHPRNRLLYRFSAAASAIKFLDSLEPSTRLYLRRISLDEDQVSVAHPERHGNGMVRFCDENPLLRIERRVNVWKALVPQDLRGLPDALDTWPSQSRWKWSHYPLGSTKKLLVENDWRCLGWFSGRDEGRYRIEPNITELVAVWAAEALNLQHSSRITLVFDGDSVPELASEMFDKFVLRDAVWQAALERSFTSGTLPCPRAWTWVPGVPAGTFTQRPEVLSQWRTRPSQELRGCIFERFPDMIREIIDGSSPSSSTAPGVVVRLNFPSKACTSKFMFDQQVGSKIAELEMIDEHPQVQQKELNYTDELKRRRKLHRWLSGWEKRCEQDAHVDPIPPLATGWSEILEGNMLPKPTTPGSEDQQAADSAPMWWDDWDWKNSIDDSDEDDWIDLQI